MKQQSQLVVAALALLTLLLPAGAWSQAISISVGPDQALVYPANMTVLPDEHVTFFPPAAGSNAYTVFAASNVGAGVAGTVVLQTTDLTTFTPALGYTNPVMSPPVHFTACDPAFNSEFDENYSGQGSVLQDPTLPPGNLMMFYEAENHCPGGVWQQPFYASIGFARSSDNGVTWPAPENGALGGANRYPVLKLVAPEPAAEPVPAPMGNAIPAAFVDKDYVYVVYVAPPGPGLNGDGKLRVARARLGSTKLSFAKWYIGSFSQPGVGGLDSGVLPQGGCVGAQGMGAISYIDPLGLYLLTFACRSDKAVPPVAAWYFSVATSLELEDWTVPQMIANSQYPLYAPCPGGINYGASFDGWYPSFMSPNAAPGHLGLNGSAFFLDGCDVSTNRRFASRTFSISVAPGVANYQGLWWNAAESGWGVNFAHQGDRIFATWYTYDTAGKAWWLSMLADRTAPASHAYSGPIYVDAGPPFYNFSGSGTPSAVGDGTIAFLDANTGSFAYTVNTTAPPTSQAKPIVRYDLGTGPQVTCTYGASTPNFAAATNYQDLWWVANGAESGWGVNFAHQGDSVFATWYTYDVDGTPLWLSALAPRVGASNVYTGPLYRTSGPRFDAYDTKKVATMPVGTATLTFADGNDATFRYVTSGAGGLPMVDQSKPITRFPFAASGGTLCK